MEPTIITNKAVLNDATFEEDDEEDTSTDKAGDLDGGVGLVDRTTGMEDITTALNPAEVYNFAYWRNVDVKLPLLTTLLILVTIWSYKVTVS